VRVHRASYLLLSLATILAGLASRHYADSIPRFIATYGGDTLWATTLYFLFAIALPNRSIELLAGLAISFAFVIEFSQLYHAEWIDRIRHTTPGALALGQGFLWSDLACYCAGLALACAIDGLLRRRGRRGERRNRADAFPA
jgi:hypothetical protein